MEEVEVAKYIYQQSLLLEYLLVISIVAAMFRPILLVALATAIVLLRPNERMDLPIPYMELLVPVLFLVLIVNLRKFRVHADNYCGRYLNYFIAVVLAETIVLHSGDFVEIFIYVAIGYLLYYSIILFIADNDGMKLLTRTVIICCFLICLEPLYYHLTEPVGSELWNRFHLPKSGRLQAWGMWGNANETAFIACLGIANVAFLTSKYKTKLHVVASLLLVPFFAVIIFLTASRAGFASLLLIFLPSVVLSRRRITQIVAVLAILAAVAAAHSLTPERTDAQGSTDERIDLRYRGKQIIKANPILGVGLLQARYQAGRRPLHNTYLQAFAETGIVGGLLLMTFLFKLGRQLYGAFKLDRAIGANPHLVFMVGLYCSSIFYFFWGNQLLSIFFFLVMAQIISAMNSATADANLSQV
jgi:O-antigen ligase